MITRFELVESDLNNAIASRLSLMELDGRLHGYCEYIEDFNSSIC